MAALVDHETLYAALVARDPQWDGRAFVGVTSTGIFCRLTCAARKPKSENCQFYDTVAACLAAGFRPCKRCRPLADPEAPPAVTALVAALETNPNHRWSEADVVARGWEPSTVRRAFQRQFGMTFLEMARQLRLREGFSTLAAGGSVIDAQLNAQFESPSAFRDAFARLLGRSPQAFLGEADLRADWIETPLGAMVAVADAHGLHLLEFLDRRALPTELRRLAKTANDRLGIGSTAVVQTLKTQLSEYFSGRRPRFDVPTVLHGSSFTQTVWRALDRIPAGETKTYTEIAQAVGRPDAVRAVARANGANQLALIVPCHRVIGADGSLTGYGGGLWRKRRLLQVERVYRSMHKNVQ